MSAHESERHAEALAVDVLGAPDPSHAFEASPLAACAGCRELVQDHLELARRLEVAGAEERAEIADALASLPATNGAAERRLLDEIRRGTAGAAPVRRPVGPWLRWLAAAAVLAACWLWATRPSAPERDQLLGQELEILSPLGEVESFAAFRWSFGELGSGWFQVVVTPADALPGAEPYDSGPLWEREWNPDPELITRWGARIRWRVEVYSGAGGGALLDSQPASAWLRSR